MVTGATSNGPLHGIRVLDLTTALAGPLAATMLADQGAEVVKVEAPGIGDIARWVGANRNGMSSLFLHGNRGKRAIVVNLHEPDGVDIVRRLAARSDVVVQNYRPGVADRLGIGPDELRAGHPELVYVSVSGFGPAGPYAHKRVYDNVIQAYSGLGDAQADPATGEPEVFRQLFVDKVTGYTVCQAITAALLARERGVGGQHVEVAMLDAAIAFLWPDTGGVHTFLDDGAYAAGSSAPAYLRFADGWGTATPLADSEFHGFCAAFGITGTADDPKLRTVGDRMSNGSYLRATLERVAEVAARTTTVDAIAAMEAHDVPCGVVIKVGDLPADPQVVANSVFDEAEHPVAGRIRQVRPPARFETTPVRPSGPAPAIGAHTDEILRELGLGDDAAELRARGVVS